MMNTRDHSPDTCEVARQGPAKRRPRKSSDDTELTDVELARRGSTPDALTIIDPFAARVRLRRLSDGADIL
ncbi:MAG: hypothetical protein AAGD13_18530 [Pseudomonadota bacterium]